MSAYLTFFSDIPWWTYFIVGFAVIATITGALICYYVPCLRKKIFPFRDRERYKLIRSDSGSIRNYNTVIPNKMPPLPDIPQDILIIPDKMPLLPDIPDK